MPDPITQTPTTPAQGAPATPAQTPTPSQGSQASGSGATAPEPKTFKAGDFSDLDTLGGSDDAAQGSPDPKASTKTGDTPAPKPGDQTHKPAGQGEDLDEDGVPKTFKTNKELRQWAVNQSKTARQAADTIKSLETKLKGLEGKPGREAEFEELQKKLTLVESRVNDYEQKLRFVDYRQSSEYIEKYEAPLNRAVSDAHKETEELEVLIPGEDGTFTTRPATKADFNKIYHMPLGEATKAAKEMFGDSASIVLGHRRDIKKLSDSAAGAIEEYKTKGATIEKERRTQTEAQQHQIEGAWKSANDDLVKKYPKWFSPEEGDKEGNDLLEKGYSMVDSAFGPERNKLTVQQRIAADAHIRNRAAAFGRMAYKNKKLSEQLAEKDKLIEQLRSGAPGGKPAGGAGGGGQNKKKTWEEAIDDLPE